MGIKTYKPITPSRRYMTTSSFDDITRKEPLKSLLIPKKKTAGRNNAGRVTCRHKGGGSKRLLRIIDFKRNKYNIPARVDSIEYDPNRNSRIALLVYKDGEKRYIIAPSELKVGDEVVSGENVPIKVGNSLPLANIPVGIFVHNVELYPKGGAKFIRSAGTMGQILAKEGDYVSIRMPSGEVRLFNRNCFATIGKVGNEEHKIISIGKAGRSRWLGIRPSVRGTAMNPCDHPHGGGEGKNKSAGRHPCSPWGKLAKGFKTRRKSKSNKLIAKRRK